METDQSCFCNVMEKDQKVIKHVFNIVKGSILAQAVFS